MPEVNVEVYCSCGEGLCNQTESKTTRHRGEPCFIVSPCEKCLDRATDKGFDDGYAKGEQKGYEEGQQDAAGQRDTEGKP